MLLYHLAEFARSKNLLTLDAQAFRPKAVRWIITLDEAGNLEGKGPVDTSSEGQGRGQELCCPQTTIPKNAGGMAEFLADSITAIFGLNMDPTEPMSEKQKQKFNNFWIQIEDAYNKTSSPALKTVLSFKPEPNQVPSFLRWGPIPAPLLNSTEKSDWWVTLDTGEEVKLKKQDNFTFRVGGMLILEEESIRLFWKSKFKEQAEALGQNTARGLCSITGKREQPIAKTHTPKIKGIRGTGSQGAALVSFDKASFTSYGFKQSLNAPTSIYAATAYCTALNWMLSRSTYSIHLGQISYCFWVQDETNTICSPKPLGNLLQQADPKAVGNFLKSPWKGLKHPTPQKDQFYAIAFAGNGGRIAVRHWMQVTLKIAADNLQRWFQDLNLEPACVYRTTADKEGMPPLALRQLACTVIPQRDTQKAKTAELPRTVTVQLFRAALKGGALPLTLLYSILHRLRVDMACHGSAKTLQNHSRFALVKLILNRSRKDNIMEITPRQNADTDDVAYQCGQLLAVLAEAQAKAHEYQLQGAGITERYFGAAMVSPAYVFPILLKLNRHHLNRIGKSNKYKGHEGFLENTMQDILSKFNQFPQYLDLHAQGRFAIGFYQRKAEDRIAQEAAKQKKNTKPTIDPEMKS